MYTLSDPVLVICPQTGQSTGVFILLLYHYHFYLFKDSYFVFVDF